MKTLHRIFARLKLAAICALIIVGGYYASPSLRAAYSPDAPFAKAASMPAIDYEPTGVAHPKKKKAKPSHVSPRDAD